ncbi:Putative uncharacterized protein YjlB [Colletotrichum destructivum]|uniref:Cupin type-1 domain-containing protein n=1 Tax=Colletotrichum destructivum TaxID=34406 RepID=A0AAX4IFH4_9PEZI|nr:Putative uncharacterized protein YjlB [Colletotrichum destructivum]
MSSNLALTPLSSLRVSRHLIPAHGLLPNTSIQNRPLLIYHGVFPSSSSASAIEAHLRSVGVVEPQWRYTMYTTTHYHSTTHEVLCVSAGRARLCFGGEANPHRVEPVVEGGDVLVVPAGVAHRLLEDLDGGRFEMVGSYPGGHDWDMCYGRQGEEAKAGDIDRVAWFSRDPVYGDDGPVVKEP